MKLILKNNSLSLYTEKIFIDTCLKDFLII